MKKTYSICFLLMAIIALPFALCDAQNPEGERKILIFGSGGGAPAAHAASHTDGSDDIQDATAAQKGLATATQITKLDAITGTNTGDFSGDNFEIVVTDGSGALTTSPIVNQDYDLTLPSGTGKIIFTAGNGDTSILGDSYTLTTVATGDITFNAGTICGNGDVIINSANWGVTAAGVLSGNASCLTCIPMGGETCPIYIADPAFSITSCHITILGNTSGTNSGDLTIGTANGLSLCVQAISLSLSSACVTGALSNTDWVTFNGKQSTLIFGILNGNAVDIDSASVASGEYAKFTANGLESKSFAEVKTDLSLNNVENTALSTFTGTSNITILGTIATGTWQGDDIAFANIADLAANSLFGNPTACAASGTNVGLGAGLGFDGCGNLENTSMNGSLALLQIRRSTSLALTGSFVDVTFNQTDHETIAATLEHNNTNTDDIDFKVNGFYRITVNGHAELTVAGCSLSADINYRMRLNDTTVFNGSCYGPVALRSGNSQTNNAYVGSSFFVNITCAPDKGTFQMNEAGGNIILIECLTITVEQQ